MKRYVFTLWLTAFAAGCATAPPSPAGPPTDSGAAIEDEAPIPTRFTAVTAGLHHTCGLRADGSVDCWGRPGDGRLEPPETPFASIEAGPRHTCGQTEAGERHCWGSRQQPTDDTPGRLRCSLDKEEGTVDCRDSDHPLDWGLEDREEQPVELASSASHACLRFTDGSIDCRGSSLYGQAVSKQGDYRDLAVGAHHTCAVSAGGAIDCWGADQPTDDSGSPPQASPHFGQSAPPATRITALSVGAYQTCLTLEDGRVRCWGGAEEAARSLLSGGEVFDSEVGGTHGCAIHETPPSSDIDSPRLFSCWQNSPGERRGTIRRFPPDSPQLEPLKELAVGGAHWCALYKHSIKCWGLGHIPGIYEGPGDRHQGVLYGAGGKDPDAPLVAGESSTCRAVHGKKLRCRGATIIDQRFETPKRFQNLTVARRTVCGRYADNNETNPGQNVCWGTRSFPDDFDPTSYRQLSAGRGFECGIEQGSDLVRCWGPAAETFNVPTEPMRTIDAATLPPTAEGDGWICGVTRTNEIRCWGGDPGALQTPEPGPTEPARVEDIAAGRWHTCLVAEDGRTDCWGANNSQATHAPDVPLKAIDAGPQDSCGLTDGGEVICWGNSADWKRRPLEGSYEQLAVGDGRGCALRADGTVDCWSYPHPVRTPPAYHFRSIDVAGSTACGVRREGTLHCWEIERPRSGHCYEISSVDSPPCYDYKHRQTGRLHTLEPPKGAFASVSIGRHHGCGIREDGRLDCWGLGSDPCHFEEPGDYEQAAPPEGRFRDVAVGEAHSCGLREDGSIVCWGVGTTPDTYGRSSTNPGQTAPPEGTFDSIWSGDFHLCARRTDRPTVCWGLGSDPNSREGGADYNQAWRPRTWSGRPGIKTYAPPRTDPAADTDRRFYATCPKQPASGEDSVIEISTCVAEQLATETDDLKLPDLFDNAFIGEDKYGLRVKTRPGDSPLAHLGMRKGDVVVRAAGKPVRYHRHIEQFFEALREEGEAGVAIIRDNRVVHRQLKVHRRDQPSAPQCPGSDSGADAGTRGVIRARGSHSGRR